MIQKLKGLNVRTESGARLGRVTDCVWDQETMRIVQLKVGAVFLGSFMGPHFLVHWENIVRVDLDAIIVKDAAVSGKAGYQYARG